LDLGTGFVSVGDSRSSLPESFTPLTMEVLVQDRSFPGADQLLLNMKLHSPLSNSRLLSPWISDCVRFWYALITKNKIRRITID
jgi:hypothetical protein